MKQKKNLRNLGGFSTTSLSNNNGGGVSLH